MSKSVPHKCPRCCSELVEVEDGRVPGIYARLVFPADPPPHLCPNCKSELIPVVATKQQKVS